MCSTHLRKLSSIPFFSTVSSEAFSEWVSEAANCDDTPHLIRVVNCILQDKQLPRNRGDILAAINATREYQQPAELYEGGCCGREIEGKTYLSNDPSTSPTADQWALRDPLPKLLLPAKCVNGWVHWTMWREVKPEIVGEDGWPLKQPYEFSGRCRCQPGGTV